MIFKHTYLLIIAFLIMSISVFAQDKLFLKNGTVLPCKIVALSANTISYKDSLQNINTISKTMVLIAEYKTGEVYIFGNTQSLEVTNNTNETREQRKERKMREWKEKESKLSNGILGFYPTQIPLGRLTLSYERLFNNKTIGVCVPVSATYDMIGVLNVLSASSNTTSSGNTTSNNRPVQRGFGIITGIDLNYYHDLKPELKYFFGPRFRYGTAMTFGGVEFLSFQIQQGIMKSSGEKFTQSLSVGVGFFKLSSKYTTQPGYEPNQVYPSGSITWRLGFRL